MDWSSAGLTGLAWLVVAGRDQAGRAVVDAAILLQWGHVLGQQSALVDLVLAMLLALQPPRHSSGRQRLLLSHLHLVHGLERIAGHCLYKL